MGVFGVARGKEKAPGCSLRLGLIDLERGGREGSRG